MNNNNYALLDNITHKDLRVIPHYSAEFGDNVASVPVFATVLAQTDLSTLHQRYYLLGLYQAMTSLSNIQTLIDLKNIRKQHEQQAYV